MKGGLSPGLKAARTRKLRARRAQLVCQQLERISSRALEEHQDIIKLYTRGRNGVYALYKGDKLYYVGLATNLRGRLKQHLKDRHRGLWDRFSVYLTIGDHHIKEMESLLLRITRPKGNKQAGKFVKCDNLIRRFKADLKAKQRDDLDGLLGVERNLPRKIDFAKRPALARYVHQINRHRLRCRYKGKVYRARVRSDGSITIRGKRGTKFNSPSQAAIEILKRNANGWYWWEYERAPNDWVRLENLRSG
jgi:hypothetical protein